MPELFNITTDSEDATVGEGDLASAIDREDFVASDWVVSDAFPEDAYIECNNKGLTIRVKDIPMTARWGEIKFTLNGIPVDIQLEFENNPKSVLLYAVSKLFNRKSRTR